MLRTNPLATHSFVARNPPRHPSVPAAPRVAAAERTHERTGPPWGLLAHEGLAVHLDADVFVFDDSREASDRDAIADFRPGKDKIDLTRTDKFGGADFDAVLAAMDNRGGDTVIDMGQGTLTLRGVEASDLDEEDFIL